MSKGREKHHARMAAVASLGRNLSRRARNHCELCGEGGSLKVIEVEPVLEEPDEERAILVCPRCENALGKGRPDPMAMRFLETTIWAETRPAQIAAVRITRSLAADGVPWAADALDDLYLDEKMEALLG
jgi:hypothetical protein